MEPGLRVSRVAALLSAPTPFDRMEDTVRDDPNVNDSSDEGDGATHGFFPSIEILDEPEPLTIDGHRLLDELTDDD